MAPDAEVLSAMTLAASPVPEAGPAEAAPTWVSYSSLSTYDACPRRYAFRYVEQVPSPEPTPACFSFGSAAHAAFEMFTRERRERPARGEPAPTREDLLQVFDAEWTAAGPHDPGTEAAYRARVAGLLDHFLDGEAAGEGETIAEEQRFELPIEPGDGMEPARLSGVIDRIDRLPGGGIEVIDYKTGRPWPDAVESGNLQLTLYALACRDALGLGTPERVTLSFPESPTRFSSTRTDAQLDAARSDIIGRVARIRLGDFAATPSTRTCDWCDYRVMCPERA